MQEDRRVVYEWDCETVDENGDVQNHDHGTLDEVIKASTEPSERGCHFEIVLVRDVWDTYDDDLRDRQWAYVEDGKLPKCFSDGARVPIRFHRLLTSKFGGSR